MLLLLVIDVAFACHSERSEEPPHFAFAYAFAFAFAFVFVFCFCFSCFHPRRGSAVVLPLGLA
jgi:hypothetical protein